MEREARREEEKREKRRGSEGRMRREKLKEQHREKEKEELGARTFVFTLAHLLEQPRNGGIFKREEATYENKQDYTHAPDITPCPVIWTTAKYFRAAKRRED